MVAVVLFQCESLMRILDTVALYTPKSISFPVVFLSLTVGVLYSLRIMNSGRRNYFKYIKQTVSCSHVVQWVLGDISDCCWVSLFK